MITQGQSTQIRLLCSLTFDVCLVPTLQRPIYQSPDLPLTCELSRARVISGSAVVQIEEYGIGSPIKVKNNKLSLYLLGHGLDRRVRKNR